MGGSKDTNERHSLPRAVRPTGVRFTQGQVSLQLVREYTGAASECQACVVPSACIAILC